jgi:hypothetical protein
MDYAIIELPTILQEDAPGFVLVCNKPQCCSRDSLPLPLFTIHKASAPDPEAGMLGPRRAFEGKEHRLSFRSKAHVGVSDVDVTGERNAAGAPHDRAGWAALAGAGARDQPTVCRPKPDVAQRLPTSGCPAYLTSFSRSPLIALPQMS